MSAASLILHIPHASTAVPPSEREALLLDDAALTGEILAITDMHTHELYDVSGAARVVFPVSRLVVDPERFADDAQEPMAARGMGVIYTQTSRRDPLRLPPSPEARRRLLEEYYLPHHAKLETEVRNARQRNGGCLIADCHSFPSRALPYEEGNDAPSPTGGDPRPSTGGDSPRPEICIGTDAFHTPPALSERLLGAFRRQGFHALPDTPFSGALTPSAFYRKDPRVLSVMIEVRRDLYMDETTGRKSPSFEDVAAALRANLEDLAAFGGELLTEGKMGV